MTHPSDIGPQLARVLASANDRKPVTDAERAEFDRLIARQKVRETVEGKWPGGLGLWDVLEAA